MANSQETNVNLKINRVPDEATLADMVANDQIQPNQLYMLPSELGTGVVTMKTKVLWTNSSPTSAFAAQTISNLDMTNYDIVCIEFKRYNGTSSSYLQSFKNVISSNNFINTVYYSSGTNTVTRGFTINETSITFETCYTNGNTSTANCIPIKIYGIKLIESPTQITNKYSTDETVVGEWIDGKPIYRKVFEFESNLTISNTTWTDTNINQASYNIEKIINCRGLKDANVWFVNLAGGGEINSSPNIFLQACRDGSSFPINAIILEYTKTTD